MVKFILIVTGFNCESFVYRCAESIMNQTYSNWQAIFISDGSTDKTEREIRAWKDKRIIAEIHSDNKGAAYRRYYAIHKYAQASDVICLIGMDDSLKPFALEIIAEQYNEGKLMTYGNWCDQFGNVCDSELEFDETTHTNRNYRKVKFRSTHINTFKKILFNNLTENDFKVNGEWIRCTTESPIMFAAMEMSGKERIGVIHEPIYNYTMRGRQNARRTVGEGVQEKVYAEIISRPKFYLYAS